MALAFKREQFDASKPLVVQRPFVSEGRLLSAGDKFELDADDLQMRRIKTLYEHRYLRHSNENDIALPKPKLTLPALKPDKVYTEAQPIKPVIQDTPKLNPVDEARAQADKLTERFKLRVAGRNMFRVFDVQDDKFVSPAMPKQEAIKFKANLIIGG